jgi:hypothetical protein
MPVPVPASSLPPEIDSTIDPAENVAHFPGLTQWLEQVQRDPAAPRFHEESVSHQAMMGALGVKHTFVGPRGHDTPFCDITVHGVPLARRKEFWQAQPVRAAPHSSCFSG